MTIHPGAFISLLVATVEAAGVLLLLGHPLCRRHMAAVGCLSSLLLLELCESLLWALAAQGTCDQLNAILVRICAACLASQPLAIAIYAHSRRNLAPVPAETGARTMLLIQLGAVFLVGNVLTAGGTFSVQSFLASLFPLSAGEVSEPPSRHSCATLGPAGDLRLWDSGVSHVEARAQSVAWWTSPDALSWPWSFLSLAGAALIEISLRYSLLPTFLALGAQALLQLVTPWDAAVILWPAGLTLTAFFVLEPLCCAARNSPVARPPPPQTTAACVACGLLLVAAVPSLATRHSDVVFWLARLELAETMLLVCTLILPAVSLFVLMTSSLLRFWRVRGREFSRLPPSPSQKRAKASGKVATGPGPSRCTAPGTGLPFLDGTDAERRVTLPRPKRAAAAKPPPRRAVPADVEAPPPSMATAAPPRRRADGGWLRAEEAPAASQPTGSLFVREPAPPPPRALLTATAYPHLFPEGHELAETLYAPPPPPSRPAPLVVSPSSPPQQQPPPPQSTTTFQQRLTPSAVATTTTTPMPAGTPLSLAPTTPSLAAAALSAADDDIGVAYADDEAHRELHRLFQGCVRLLDLGDLPGVQSHLAPLRRLVWKHFEAMAFAFCTHAKRPRGAQQSWQMDKEQFSALCAKCRLLPPSLSTAEAEDIFMVVRARYVRAAAAAVAAGRPLPGGRQPLELHPFLHALLHVAQRRGEAMQLGSPDVASRRQSVQHNPQGGLLEGFETTLLQLGRAVAVAVAPAGGGGGGGSGGAAPPPLTLVPGVRRELRDVEARQVFASHDMALRRLFRQWAAGGGPTQTPGEQMGIERWLALMAAVQKGSGPRVQLSDAHLTACFFACLLVPGGTQSTAISYSQFKEAVARAAVYAGHGRAFGGGSPLVAKLRELCGTLISSPGAWAPMTLEGKASPPKPAPAPPAAAPEPAPPPAAAPAPPPAPEPVVELSDTEVLALLREGLRKNASRVSELFLRIDKDRSGSLSKAEFRKVKTIIGIDVSDAQLDALFDSWDPDGSGSLSLKELNQVIKRGAPAPAPKAPPATKPSAPKPPAAKPPAAAAAPAPPPVPPPVVPQRRAPGATAKKKFPTGSHHYQLIQGFDIDEHSEQSATEQLRDALAKHAVRVVDLFNEWDDDQTGSISRAEFRQGMEEMKFHAPQSELDALFDEWDPDDNGTIELKEMQHLLRRGKANTAYGLHAYEAGAKVDGVAATGTDAAAADAGKKAASPPPPPPEPVAPLPSIAVAPSVAPAPEPVAPPPPVAVAPAVAPAPEPVAPPAVAPAVAPADSRPPAAERPPPPAGRTSPSPPASRRAPPPSKRLVPPSARGAPSASGRAPPPSGRAAPPSARAPPASGRRPSASPPSVPPASGRQPIPSARAQTSTTPLISGRAAPPASVRAPPAVPASGRAAQPAVPNSAK